MASEHRPLRVLHVCPRPSFSGLEAYALDVAKSQHALGHRIQFVVLSGSPLEAKCRDAGLETISIAPGLTARLKFIFQMTMRLASRSNKPEIVHLHSTQDLDLLLLPFAASRLLRHDRPRVVLQTHIWISHSKRDPLHAFSYALVDEVWCSSAPAKQTLEKFLPISADRIRVISYGRDIKRMEANFLPRDEARRSLKLPTQAIVIGTVARIDEGKGTRELLEGALLSMQKHPDIPLHLILIGPPTADDPRAVEYGKNLFQRIASLPAPLRDRIEAPGAIADSYRYLKAFDLFALPTYQECFALSLLEAQLAGLPCIATNSGGSPEIVREGETGWLFKPRSSEALHAALEQALHDTSRWNSFGARAQKRVRQDFDFSKLLPQTLIAYRKLLD